MLPWGIRASLLLQPTGLVESDVFLLLYWSFLLSISSGFTSVFCPHSISYCSLHSVQELHPSTRPGLAWGSYSPSQTWCATFSLHSAGASLSFLQEVIDPGCSWTSCQARCTAESSWGSQRSSPFCSPDQLIGTIHSWSLVWFWALVTFMLCLAICWKMLVAMMPKALLSCAWRRW